ncbi:MAG: Gfo/Idh/MocA family oxidoreductase [Prevotellaceae bacterium]|jgi:virulence factor|nr:Gfo/Idh/MocA family oxidoreductase [Prevotellaceae bacterium]
MENIINILKKIRKHHLLRKSYSGGYAFVGIGNHSLHNLYPVLHYLNVPLQYIVTKSQSTANLINKNEASVVGTTDLERVLADPAINGVFICTHPDSHYELVNKALSYKKNVFVEKPPCTNTEELEKLITAEKNAGKTVLVGLQKRYSACVDILKKEISIPDVISYNYRFVVGSYPDGDPYWDLFIHPVDLIAFIFGRVQSFSVVKTSHSKGEVSVFVQIQHEKIVGSVEMSTQYAWNCPEEHLIINTSKGVYRMTNHQLLDFQPASGTLFSLPKEKIFSSVPQTKHLFNGNNFLPVIENNQLMAQGFYSELKTFVDICENKKNENRSSLTSLIPTFDLLSKIKKQ